MTSSVISNNEESMYEAAKYIIMSGKKRIALLGCHLDCDLYDAKCKGYKKAIKEYGYEEFIIYSEEHNKDDIYKQFNHLLEKNKNIDGLICTTQTKTKIALDLLKTKNITIPDRISVIGYSDDLWCKLVNPPLTVISENMYKMGEIATNLLLKMLEEGADKLIQNLIIKNQFIIRKSA
jgi:LacI family transcriptional regulator